MSKRYRGRGLFVRINCSTNPAFLNVAEERQHSRLCWSSFGQGCELEPPVRRMIIALAIGALSGQTLAADLPRPVPPGASVAFIPSPPVFTWSGIYVGCNGGYSVGMTTLSVGGLSAAGFSTNGAVADSTIGGDYQSGAFVFCAEGDFDSDDIKGNPSACVGCQVSSHWLATGRVRVGAAASGDLHVIRQDSCGNNCILACISGETLASVTCRNGTVSMSKEGDTESASCSNGSGPALHSVCPSE